MKIFSQAITYAKETAHTVYKRASKTLATTSTPIKIIASLGTAALVTGGAIYAFTRKAKHVETAETAIENQGAQRTTEEDIGYESMRENASVVTHEQPKSPLEDQISRALQNRK